ncbi:hypothetical protein O988_05090, partial [Pseudogymnoascus sp. VKM F-3808]
TYESDLEAGLCESKTSAGDGKFGSSRLALAQKKSSGGANKECTVWPGQKALKEAKLAEKRRTDCWNPLRGLDSRTKFWVKIAIGAVIVGLAVAVVSWLLNSVDPFVQPRLVSTFSHSSVSLSNPSRPFHCIYCLTVSALPSHGVVGIFFLIAPLAVCRSRCRFQRP